MGDKKYVKLKPAKMGFEFLGVVKPKRRSMLVAAFETIKRDMGASWNSRLEGKEVFWLNIWQDEADIEEDSDVMGISDPEIAKSLDKWSRKAALKYCGSNAIIDGYGFAVNPMGSEYQPWHIDYATDCANVFIPITPHTEKNAMQYITLPPDTPEDVLEQVASDTDKVDIDALERGVDYLIVQQVIAKPMSVLLMGRGTIHRGVPNTGEDQRVTFYISVHYIKDYDKNYPYDSDSLQEPEHGVVTIRE